MKLKEEGEEEVEEERLLEDGWRVVGCWGMGNEDGWVVVGGGCPWVLLSVIVWRIWPV